MSRDADVIVVGAAVAGTAVANAIGKLGLRTLVLEKGAERDNDTRGDILHPPTLAFLEPWGILEALHADGSLPIEHLAVSHRELGRLATYPVPARGLGPAGRSIAVPHDRIEAVMKQSLQRWSTVQLERATVVGLVQDESGRTNGVRAQTIHGERTFHASLVVGCDGSQSIVRRQLGIDLDRQPYDHELLYIAADGATDPARAMHFHLDRQGVILVASRPSLRMRIAIYFQRGARGDLLKRADPALHDYVVDRIPALVEARFSRQDVHVYSLVRQLAERFALPGAALVGDSAHTTHPTGATGMNLAITAAARLAELVGPVLLEGPNTVAQHRALDEALAAYEAERRPAAAQALEHNHNQAQRIWPPDPDSDPWGYARAADPSKGWGAGGAGWGQNPAALSE